MRSDLARVSVCVATYNQARYIEDCVLSVLAQAGQFELEVLVGDDNSTDGTAEILKALELSHPGRLHVIRRGRNLGPIGNYQDLVRRASGTFIAHLDGDDAWLPGKLRAQLQFMAEHPECPAVYTNAIVQDTEGRFVAPFTNAQPALMSFAYICARGNYLLHSSTLYRACWKNEFLRMEATAIDYGIHLAFARHGALGFIDASLASYRVATATSLVRTSFPLVQRRVWEALKEASTDLQPRQKRAAIAHFIAGTLLSCFTGDARTCWSLLKEAIAHAEGSRALLLLSVIPPLSAIGTQGVLRRLLRRTGVGVRLAEHYRA